MALVLGTKRIQTYLWRNVSSSSTVSSVGVNMHVKVELTACRKKGAFSILSLPHFQKNFDRLILKEINMTNVACKIVHKKCKIEWRSSKLENEELMTHL